MFLLLNTSVVNTWPRFKEMIWNLNVILSLINKNTRKARAKYDCRQSGSELPVLIKDQYPDDGGFSTRLYRTIWESDVALEYVPVSLKALWLTETSAEDETDGENFPCGVAILY